MGNNRKLQFAVRAALAAAAATAVVPTAWSQTAPAAANESPNAGLEEVVVTGSRITSPNLTAISPITSVDAGYISSTNLTRVEDILNNLPMVFAGQNSTVSNGATGTASVNLRGLGPQRTLVLVNGRRLGPGQGTGTNVSDINEVPAALIERVDILTGGASSVYGADAVAGVVNFVLNTHFEGVKIDTSYSYFQHQNNNSLAQGAVTAAGDRAARQQCQYRLRQERLGVDGFELCRQQRQCDLLSDLRQSGGGAGSEVRLRGLRVGCHEAGARFAMRWFGHLGEEWRRWLFPSVRTIGAALFTNTVDGKTGAFRPFTAADDYNFGPLNFYQRPNERWTGGSFLNYADQRSLDCVRRGDAGAQYDRCADRGER